MDKNDPQVLALLIEIRDLLKVIAKSDVSIDDAVAGEVFRQSMIAKADGDSQGAPLWHGWALMDAFLAGAKHGRDLRKSPVSH